MSSETSDVHEDVRLTRCIVDGCDYSVRYLEEVPNGYRLTCGDHAGEDAVDLAEFDFRAFFDDNWPGADRHPAVKRVATTSKVLDAGVKETGSGTTVSIVTRDRDDDELLKETVRYVTPGLYALVRVDRGEVEDIDEYRGDREGPPEWLEWIRCEPPMEHHVRAIRCRECGAEDTLYIRAMPAEFSAHDWGKLHHEPACEHADEDDVARAKERDQADEIRDRVDPSVMALSCIWSEVGDLRILEDEERWGFLHDPIYARYRAIEDVLVDRLNPRFPSCPSCDGELTADHEGIIECRDCRFEDVENYPVDIEHEYNQQRHRVWGWRGHGGRRPAEANRGDAA